MSNKNAVFFSKGIEKISGLNEFLDDEGFVLSRKRKLSFKPIHAVFGWGKKETSLGARNFAAARNITYIALEDGFLRSLGLGVEGALQHSLIVDYSGIYYDATSESDLERFIRNNTLSEKDSSSVRFLIELLKRYRLSKYNQGLDNLSGFNLKNKKRVLVVDQTFGDASIVYGKASAAHFRKMLNEAIRQNVGAEILVKTHPDVITGKKNGYLLDIATQKKCTLISQDISPWALLDAVDKVYVVTSQLGFEALLAGKEVHCFGMPFYAGWGLTHDRQQCERRGIKKSIEELFAASYLQYCRYINPYTGRRCSFEDTAALLSDQKRMRDRYSGEWQVLGFSRWKQGFVTPFFGANAQVNYHRTVPKSSSTISESRWLIWSSKEDHKQALKAHDNVWFMEDGFLRSVGLGANMVTPMSLVIDSKGIYYDPTCPSDLEDYLNFYSFSDDLIDRAKKIAAQLVQLKLSKYNVGSKQALTLPEKKRIILVPGQVETDASIRFGTQAVNTNFALLEAVRKDNPDAYIIYKPHPDVLAGARLADSEQQADAVHYDLLVEDIAMPVLLDQVDEVHTMTSLTGFEALLRGLEVTTYGLPFYAGWGLTKDYYKIERRQRTLTLEQLVASVMILYPVYIDPDTGDQINVETAITLIDRDRHIKPKSTLYSFFRKLTRKPY